MEQKKVKQFRKAFKAAFPHTIPIFAGFWFLGMTYGIYMNVSGFSFWYPMLMSMTIFAGSMEFITVNLLLGVFTFAIRFWRSSVASLCENKNLPGVMPGR